LIACFICCFAPYKVILVLGISSLSGMAAP
jgi:predicted metal-binding membrane protein